MQTTFNVNGHVQKKVAPLAKNGILVSSLIIKSVKGEVEKSDAIHIKV